MPARYQRLDAPSLYLILRGAGALFFSLIVTINLVYQVETARLNPLQLILVGTVLEGAVFLLEVPTGVVADIYSRRLSIIIGIFLIGAGFLLEGAVPLFPAILIAQVLWGAGFTFTSGAEQAWIADEVGEERAGQLYLRGAQANLIGSLLAVPLSVALATVSLNLPILAGGGLYLLLGVFLIVAMPERGFRPTPREDRTTWETMRGTFLHGARVVRGRPLLITILVIAAFHGMASEGFDRLWTPHILRNIGFPTLGALDPVIWFGVIRVGAMLLSLAATEAVRRRLDTRSHTAVARALLVISALLLACTLLYALARSFPAALAAFWGATVLRRVHVPLSTAWLNQNLDSRVRATVNSISSQSDALGQIAGGPAIGVIGTVISLRAALLTAALALTPALPLYARAVRQGDETPAPATGEERRPG